MFVPINLRYTMNHLWLRDVGRQDVYVGITDYAQKELGRVDSIEMQHVGHQRKKGESFGIIYGANKSEELIMPFAGQIFIVNPDIEKHPGIVNSDPYYYWIVMLTAATSLVDNKTKYFTSEDYQIVINRFKST